MGALFYQKPLALILLVTNLEQVSVQWLETLTQDVHITARQLVNTGQPINDSIDISLKIDLLDVLI